MHRYTKWHISVWWVCVFACAYRLVCREKSEEKRDRKNHVARIQFPKQYNNYIYIQPHTHTQKKKLFQSIVCLSLLLFVWNGFIFIYFFHYCAISYRGWIYPFIAVFVRLWIHQSTLYVYVAFVNVSEKQRVRKREWERKCVHICYIFDCDDSNQFTKWFRIYFLLHSFWIVCEIGENLPDLTTSHTHTHITHYWFWIIICFTL